MKPSKKQSILPQNTSGPKLFSLLPICKVMQTQTLAQCNAQAVLDSLPEYDKRGFMMIIGTLLAIWWWRRYANLSPEDR